MTEWTEEDCVALVVNLVIGPITASPCMAFDLVGEGSEVGLCRAGVGMRGCSFQGMFSSRRGRRRMRGKRQPGNLGYVISIGWEAGVPVK